MPSPNLVNDISLTSKLNSASAGDHNHANGLVTSRDWTLERLLTSGVRFKTVDRIPANSRTPEQIVSIIKDCEQHSIPVVVEDLQHHLDWPEFFTPATAGDSLQIAKCQPLVS